jgi:hypothetical protein
LFSLSFGFDSQSSIGNSLWNSVGGILHGAFDFGANQVYAFNSLCCMTGAHEMDFSQEERLDVIAAHAQWQADVASGVDSGIQQFLGVDPNSEAYQNSRYYSLLALETGACVSGVYGLTKGAVKGAVGYAARRSAIMAEKAALKSIGYAGQIVESEIVLGNQVLKQVKNADFIVAESGIAIPTNRFVLERGFQEAGFKTFCTKSPGTGYVMPNGMTVRIMEPSGPAPLRASFTNLNNGPINPFSGKPPQPPRGLDPITRRDYVRNYTHVELSI